MRRYPALFCIVIASLSACSPETLVEVDAPNTVVDPSTIATEASALRLHAMALTLFDQTFAGHDFGTIQYNRKVVSVVALLTDEFLRQGPNSTASGLDERTGIDIQGTSAYEDAYRAFHQPRILLQQAGEALQRYAPKAPKALVAQTLALEGVTILWFAEVFCSGIPLSSVPIEGKPSPGRGLTTADLFERAIALFDSAIVMSPDSARILNLARVGRGRALIGLGRFAESANAVRDVPTDFVYNAVFSPAVIVNAIGQDARGIQVVDREGSNGLSWSADPRTAIRTSPAQTGAMTFSAKYSRTTSGTLDPTVPVSDNPVRVAEGVEARLIEAEADLAGGGTSWLAILNALRSECIGSAPCAPVPGLTASSLPPLTDPGTQASRLDLVMSERAMWLYLTGHRQGDLRRLVRVYGRDPQTLWPVGTYFNPGFPPFVETASTHGSTYGQDFVLNPMNAEFGNPVYTGCVNTDP